MLAAELIRRKRDGGELTAEEIGFLVTGITDGSVSDAQVGALAMAIVWRGMTKAERIALTGEPVLQSVSGIYGVDALPVRVT